MTIGGVVVGCVWWVVVGVGLFVFMAVLGGFCSLLVCVAGWCWWGFVYFVDMGA